MPGPDQYYQQQNPNAGAFKSNGSNFQGKGPQVSSGANPFTNTSGPNMAGNQNAGQQGGSPYQAGSGFINLSHLLQLNGQSGQQSAQTAANQLTQQGKTAENNINQASQDFANGVEQGTVKATDQSSYKGSGRAPTGADFYKQQLDRAMAGYTGPQSLSDTAGYGALAKNVQQTQDRARNATTGNGQAAQIAQDTGLSPRQAAASAFYQGVTNPALQRAGNQFKNIGGMLDTAETNSVKDADQANWLNGQAANYYNNLLNPQDNYYDYVPTSTVANPTGLNTAGPFTPGEDPQHVIQDAQANGGNGYGINFWQNIKKQLGI